MATCRVSNSLGRASRALLLLAAATTALAPQRSLPVRCASRSRSRVVVFADDDVETLRDQAAKLRAEVEVLQAEAAKERAEELKRNPPPPEPEKKAEAPEKKAVAALEADDDAGFSFPNPFGGGDDAPPKRAVSSDDDVTALLRIAACAPYLLPLSDVIPFSQYEAGQGNSVSSSLQNECSARARSGKSIHASRALREMIARPNISRNERKTTEI